MSTIMAVPAFTQSAMTMSETNSLSPARVTSSPRHHTPDIIPFDMRGRPGNFTSENHKVVNKSCVIDVEKARSMDCSDIGDVLRDGCELRFFGFHVTVG